VDERISNYGHHAGMEMDPQTEPVVRLDLSLFEALAAYDAMISKNGEVQLKVRQSVALQKFDEAYALEHAERTRSRSIAKLKTAIDDTLVECKRRFAKSDKTE
jgi:hypothetical protein